MSKTQVVSAVLISTLACLLCVSAWGNKNNLLLGKPPTNSSCGPIPNGTNTVLLYHEIAKKERSIGRDTVCFPPFMSSRAEMVITAVNVTNLTPGRNVGEVTVDSGGVGQSKVCISLWADFRNELFYFNIDVWGYFKK